MSFSSTRPLRFGILGAAKIARSFCVAVAHSPQLKVAAVASRHLSKAQSFAQDFGVAKAYGSYEALLADENIDAVYVPLPNSMHCEWVIRAAQAGKHILCEKPLALNAAEAEKMFAAAAQNKVMLLEAFPWMFQPQTCDMMRIITSGAIGSVRSIQANFGFMLSNAQGNIRMQRELGGGALLDAGCYPLSLILLVMGQMPSQVFAQARFVDEYQTGDGQGIDMSLTAQLQWSDGRRAQLSCSMDSAHHRLASIVGTGGVLETEYLNHVGAPLSSHMRLRAGIANTIAFEAIDSPSYAHEGSGFRFCAEAFARLIHTQDQAALSQAAQWSIGQAHTLAMIEKSARSGQIVTL